MQVSCVSNENLKLQVDRLTLAYRPGRTIVSFFYEVKDCAMMTDNHKLNWRRYQYVESLTFDF